MADAAARRDEEGKSADFLWPEGKPLPEAEDMLVRLRDDLEPRVVEYIASLNRSVTRPQEEIMVAIGVTGHRILTDLDQINAGMDRALRRIEQAFPGEPLTVISPLAEGADRLVAHRILARPKSRLVVPLPLPQADYVADFQSAESRGEFCQLLRRAEDVIELPHTSTRKEAYRAAGMYVLEHSDVLITIWDGRGAQDQGGTGGIVARARTRGMPIAWIHAGNRKPETQEPTSLGAEQGRVTFENFPLRGGL
jgi:hypothetical protein